MTEAQFNGTEPIGRYTQDENGITPDIWCEIEMKQLGTCGLGNYKGFPTKCYIGNREHALLEKWKESHPPTRYEFTHSPTTRTTDIQIKDVVPSGMELIHLDVDSLIAFSN